MPTYEYACSNGHRFEVTQRMDDPPPTACEVCGAKLRKVFHPAGIAFKGSGFYSTDSRSKPAAKKKEDKKEKAPSGSGDSSGSVSSSEKGGEKKTEPKKSTEEKTS